MRKSVPYVFVSLLALAFVLPAAAADSPQKPGKWKITMEMEMPGMPVKMPPVTTEVCITAEDLKDPQRSVPNDPKMKCTVSDYKIDGKTASWSLECPQQKITGTGQITYAEDTYTGSMKMKMGEHEMSTKYSGKWIGECTK
jgi:hypothetical protein